MAFLYFLWNLRKCVFKHLIFKVWVLMVAICLSSGVVYLALVQVSLKDQGTLMCHVIFSVLYGRTVI